MATQRLSPDVKKIYEKALLEIDQELDRKKQFEDYKLFVLRGIGHPDTPGFELHENYFDSSGVWVPFIPTESELGEVVTEIHEHNKKLKAAKQKPQEIIEFNTGTTLTTASEQWFYKLPLAKEIERLYLKIESADLEFVVQKLTGTRVKELILHGVNSSMEEVTKIGSLKIDSLVLVDPNPNFDLNTLSPELLAKTVVKISSDPDYDYGNSLNKYTGKLILDLSKSSEKQTQEKYTSTLGNRLAGLIFNSPLNELVLENPPRRLFTHALAILSQLPTSNITFTYEQGKPEQDFATIQDLIELSKKLPDISITAPNPNLRPANGALIGPTTVTFKNGQPEMALVIEPVKFPAPK